MRILVSLFLLAASTVSAQGLPSSSLRKGAWDFGVQTSGGVGLYGNNSKAGLWLVGGRIGRVLTREHGDGWYRGNFEYAMDLIPVHVVVDGRVIYGGGFNPLVLKWNFTRGKKWAPYYEASFGMLFTTANVPSGDTSRVNFVSQAGPGINFFARENRAFSAGFSFLHLSSAQLGRNNSGINAVHFTIGYHWFR